MKITKLPDDLDVNKILAQKIFEQNGKCPFCGEIDYIIYCSESDYRTYSGKWYRFWEKKHKMKKYKFECGECGGEWESDWFPQDIKVINDED